MKNDRERLLKENLDNIVSVLSEKYGAEKIILFGSMASGNVTKVSDIDLLIIKDTDKSFYDRLREVASLCDYNVGVDMLVYTPAEFEAELKENFFLRHEILEKGRVIYDSAA